GVAGRPVMIVNKGKAPPFVGNQRGRSTGWKPLQQLPYLLMQGQFRTGIPNQSVSRDVSTMEGFHDRPFRERCAVGRNRGNAVRPERPTSLLCAKLVCRDNLFMPWIQRII